MGGSDVMEQILLFRLSLLLIPLQLKCSLHIRGGVLRLREKIRHVHL